ncbi:MAG: helix-turn-helix domain-containing protein [Oscillospiraceae bacterium]|nr:helix-turn-helix domain-containing protein [Oscillospiraceae bacterium]
MRTEMERVSTFGQRLRSVMLVRGLNYAQLSELVGQRPQTLNRYILGQREPRAEAAMEIAIRLGVSLY